MNQVNIYKNRFVFFLGKFYCKARIILIIVISLLISLSSFAQAELTVEIINLRNNEGVVSFELLNGSEEIVSKFEKSIQNNRCLIVFDKLAFGQYAIRYFHDENSNKELDANWLGIPTEGYGFSNDAYTFFGPKPFEQWLFELDGDTTLVMKTNYKK